MMIVLMMNMIIIEHHSLNARWWSCNKRLMLDHHLAFLTSLQYHPHIHRGSCKVQWKVAAACSLDIKHQQHQQQLQQREPRLRSGSIKVDKDHGGEMGALSSTSSLSLNHILVTNQHHHSQGQLYHGNIPGHIWWFVSSSPRGGELQSFEVHGKDQRCQEHQESRYDR